ncbi:hypothetical protein ES703_70351 [subsurface metagenome]
MINIMNKLFLMLTSQYDNHLGRLYGMIILLGKGLGSSLDTHKGIARCPRVGKCVSTFAQQKKMPDPQGGFHLVYQNNNETNKIRLGENTILRIACKAVERRRQASAKIGKQLRINGTVQESGYAVYDDNNQYVEEGSVESDLNLRVGIS